MSEPLSTPTLYSYGAISVVPGQSISLNGVTGKAIMSASKWALSFRVRIHANPAGGQLFSMGTKGDLIVNHGVSGAEVSKTYTASTPPTLEPGSGTAPTNDVKALVKYDKDKIFQINSFRELEIGVWHTITITGVRSGKDHIFIKIYTDGSPFGLPSDSDDPGDNIWDYSNSSDTSTAVLGGGVDADFLNIVFWTENIPDETEIIENNYETPTPTPYKAFDFSALTTHGTTLNRGAHINCIDTGILFGGGVAIPDLQDQLNPGGDLSQPFSIQAWVRLEPPLTQPEALLQTAIVSNGLNGDRQAFVFGTKYDLSQGFFKAAVKFPGIDDLILDTTPLCPHIWYNLVLTWNGTDLTFYVNGTKSSSITKPSSAVLSQSIVCIGAITSLESASGYSRFFRGYIQALGIWTRALDSAEISAFESPSETIGEQAVAFYDLISTEFANSVTGRHLSFKGTTLLKDTTTTNFIVEASRLVVQHTDHVVNLSVFEYYEDNPPSTLAPEATVSLESASYSPTQIESLISEIDFYVNSAPKDLQSSTRKLLLRNWQIGLNRSDKAIAENRPVPGCFTSVVENGFHIVFFHQVNGPVEVARIDAKDIDECTIWMINMTVTAIGLVIAIAGAGFSAPKFYQAFLQVYQNNPRLAAAIRHALGQVIMTNQSLPSAVLTIVGVVYAAGVLGGIFFKAFTSNYYMLAYTVVSVMGTLLSIFVTGGATMLFFLGKIAANIVCIVYVFSQRPPNCPSWYPSRVGINSCPPFYGQIR